MSHYKTYSSYKPSHVHWIGDVPEHWELIPIRRIAKLRNDRTNESSNEVIYIGLEDVQAESGKYAPTKGSSRQSDDSTVAVFRAGDVLYGKLRPYLKKAIIAEENGICSTEFLVLNTSGILPKLLHKWLLTTDVTQQIESTCDGAKMPRADWEGVGTIPIPVPPLNEQECLSKAIDRETTRIDTLIAKKTSFIELLKEKRQAFITHAVTKGLNPNVTMKDSGIEWIGDVPEHWEVKHLRHVAIFNNSNVDKKIYEGQREVKLCNYTDVYYNEFITSDLDFMVSTASDAEIEKFRLRKGDVIITKDSEDPRDIGIPAIVLEDMDDVVCGYHLTVIKAHEDSLSKFIHRSIEAHSTKAHFFVESPGITRFGLDQDAIGNIPICVPPESERSELVQTIDRETTRIDILIAKTQHSIELLKERRSAFITAAVTGQIDVRNHINMELV
jgi:type I restriction enzyme S subunit